LGYHAAYFRNIEPKHLIAQLKCYK